MDTHTDTIQQKCLFWQRHIERWRRGGWSQGEYCRRNGLALSTFQLWRRRLAEGPQPQTADAACIELVPIPKGIGGAEIGHGRSPATIVVCVGSYRVEVPDGAHVDTLRSVIDALETR